MSLSNADANSLTVIIDDLRGLHEDMGFIGLGVDSTDGEPVNYLENNDTGKALSSKLTTAQTMCTQAAQALEEAMNDMTTS